MAVSKVVSAKMAVHQYKIAHKVFKCALIYVLVIGGIASLITFFGASVLIPSNQPKAIPVLRIFSSNYLFLRIFMGIPWIFSGTQDNDSDFAFSDCRAGG